MFLPHPRVKVNIMGSLRDREVACSASDRQGSNFESWVWRTVSSQSSHHPQEVLLAQFSLYVHKGGLKPDSFHFFLVSIKSVKISQLKTKPLIYTTTSFFSRYRWSSSHRDLSSKLSIVYEHNYWNFKCNFMWIAKKKGVSIKFHNQNRR